MANDKVGHYIKAMSDQNMLLEDALNKLGHEFSKKPTKGSNWTKLVRTQKENVKKIINKTASIPRPEEEFLESYELFRDAMNWFERMLDSIEIYLRTRDNEDFAAIRGYETLANKTWVKSAEMTNEVSLNRENSK